LTLKEWLFTVLRFSLIGLAIWLGVMVGAAHCQTLDVKLIEQLKDQSWVVRIGETEHRCLPPAQMREVLLDKAELEKSRELIANLQQQIQLLEAERDALRRADKLADEQLANVNERLAGFQKQLSAQTELLNKAINAAKRSKLAAWLDSPITSVALKLIVPGVNLLVTGLK